MNQHISKQKQQIKTPEAAKLAQGELSEAELATVTGGIIAILIGRGAPPAK